jgi:hypothetical protein
MPVLDLRGAATAQIEISLTDDPREGIPTCPVMRFVQYSVSDQRS